MVTYEVQTLQAESIRCSPLAAVHVVTKCQDNLKGNATCVTQNPHIFPVSTNPSHFNRHTSKIFFSLVEDLIDMDAEMMEFSC